MAESIQHLYVHIPFCHRICPYCSFYKHTPGSTSMRGFVDAVLSELARRSEVWSIRPETIYLGGGTPSMLSPGLLGRLLRGIAERLDLSGLREWDLEANPMTFDARKAALMRDCGVTRVSLGVQSWDPDVLKTLGRDHTPEGAADSFRILRSEGIRSVNIDLMFAIPGQSLDSWKTTLENTIALAPDHVSAYNLTYEEDTAFFEKLTSGAWTQDEGEDAEYFSAAVEMLGDAGFDHYEISNYARPGHESLHNWGYWQGRDYLGLGPGAVSTIGTTRWTNVPDTARYIAMVASGDDLATSSEVLSAEARRLEALGLQLRTRTGMALADLDEHQRSRMADLTRERLAAIHGDRLVLTERGRLVADEVAVFLS